MQYVLHRCGEGKGGWVKKVALEKRMLQGQINGGLKKRGGRGVEVMPHIVAVKHVDDVILVQDNTRGLALIHGLIACRDTRVIRWGPRCQGEPGPEGGATRCKSTRVTQHYKAASV